MNEPSGQLRAFVQAELGRHLSWASLAGDGSDRRFWRVFRQTETFVVVDGSGLSTDRFAENRSFFLIGRHLRSRGLPVPKILAHQVDQGLFLIEDLGDHLLAKAAGLAGSAERLALYRPVIEVLARLQTEGASGFDPAWCCQTPVYDQAMILRFESGYFLEAFVRDYCGLAVDTAGLSAELASLASRAAAAGPRLFLHRDFQSRNILYKDYQVRIIDFQAGRLGPPGYDLASLLLDPYVGLTQAEQAELFDYYLSLMAKRAGLEAERFRQDYPFLALHRLFQTLGAFGYLSRIKGRPGFSEHIPAALSQLHRLLAAPEFKAFPAVRHLTERLVWARGLK